MAEALRDGAAGLCFQENFELFHETLYLAVKMTDHYLSKTPVDREMLQLVGSTAMLIASKFEVRPHPPPLSRRAANGPVRVGPPGAQPALRGGLPVHLRRRLQEGGAYLHGGRHAAGAALRHQHPRPVPIPPPLR